MKKLFENCIYNDISDEMRSKVVSKILSMKNITYDTQNQTPLNALEKSKVSTSKSTEKEIIIYINYFFFQYQKNYVSNLIPKVKQTTNNNAKL